MFEARKPFSSLLHRPRLQISIAIAFSFLVILARSHIPYLSQISFHSKGATFLPETPSFPRGRLHPTLHQQQLSHQAFHSNTVKRHLLELVTVKPDDAAIIIGLAGGTEALFFAQTHPVHAFEPMSPTVEAFKRKPGADAVTVYQVAASRYEHTLNLSYKGHDEVVNASRPERLLPPNLNVAVASIDVQGAEWDAIQGLGSVLSSTASVWVEVGCHDWTEDMLRFLGKNFVLFDFVPWGRPMDGEFEQDARESFVYEERPDEITEWVEWFCTRRQEFRWLQTDVLAIRRSMLKGSGGAKIWQGIRGLREVACQDRCILADHLARES